MAQGRICQRTLEKTPDCTYDVEIIAGLCYLIVVENLQSVLKLLV
jgi:hypothetical protein